MKIAASQSYMGQEEIRQALQSVLVSRVSTGQIKNQQGLEEFWKTIDKASLALRSIPYDVLVRLTTVREFRELVRDVLLEIENTTLR